MTKKAHPSHASHPYRALLQVEALEQRNLLSVTPLESAIPKQILVHYHSTTESPVVERIAIPEHGSSEELLKELQSDPTIRYAELDYTVEIAAIPNDPRFNDQYAYHNVGQSNGKVDADIDAEEAWDQFTGNHRTTVSVIDTGIDYRHQDLYRNIWINQGEIPDAVRSRLTDIDQDGLITFVDLNHSSNQGTGKILDLNSNGYIDGGDLLKTYRSDGRGGWANGISEDGDTYVDDLIGWNFVKDTNDPWDNNGHGTHVSGIIGAMGNNGVGVTGTLWNVQMAGLKFLDREGRGFVSDAVAALDYAVAKGIKISNNSWSLGFFSQSLEDAVRRARAKGHIVVAAAGNQKQDLDNEARYPAALTLDNVVTVAATSRNDRLALFSNYGDQTVDLGAPGLHIVSTWPRDRYLQVNGTSMAAPYVTAALAMVQSLAPQMSHQEVVQQVLDNVDPLTTLEGKTITGGRLNLNNAISGLKSDPPPSPPPQDDAEEGGAKIVTIFINGKGIEPVNRVRVTFDRAIKSGSFTPSDVKIHGPNGPIEVANIRLVSNSGDKKFDITFERQFDAGLYTVVVGPDILDSSNRPLDGGAQTINFTIEGQHRYFNENSRLRILDHLTSVSFIHVDKSIKVDRVMVQVDITHPSVGDLILELRGPDGTRVVLADQRGGVKGNYEDTIFSDGASRPVSSGRPPYRSTYRPEEKLSAFNGKNASGSWQLWVTDRVSGSTGKLNSWALFFDGKVISGAEGLASAASFTDPGSSAESHSSSTSPSIVDVVEQNGALFGMGTALAGNLFQEDAPRQETVETISPPDVVTPAEIEVEETIKPPSIPPRRDEISEDDLLDFFSSFSENEIDLSGFEAE